MSWVEHKPSTLNPHRLHALHTFIHKLAPFSAFFHGFHIPPLYPSHTGLRRSRATARLSLYLLLHTVGPRRFALCSLM